LAGEAPPPIQDLSATIVERGVLLRWQSVANLQTDTFIQLQRTLLTPANGNSIKTTGLALPAEPTEQTLRVTPETGQTDLGKALDSGIVSNRKYLYRATRITRRKIVANWFEVASVPSSPADIFTRDTFPPAAPKSLAAVPVAAAINGGQPEVDLSWSANVEPDIAQYLIYRRDEDLQASRHQSTPEQLAPENPAKPIVAPAFRDLHVQPGHAYAYSIVAVDNSGNKSAESREVVVTVPNH
jgi:hypothetical protein